MPIYVIATFAVDRSSHQRTWMKYQSEAYGSVFHYVGFLFQDISEVKQFLPASGMTGYLAQDFVLHPSRWCQDMLELF